MDLCHSGKLKFNGSRSGVALSFNRHDMSVLHCRDALAFVAPALSRVDGDGFLREPGTGSAALRYAQHAVVPALAQHARGTARAFGGVWDETAARDAKSVSYTHLTLPTIYSV